MDFWEHKRREALWKRQCSISHQIWCNCGQWWSHVTGGRGGGGPDGDGVVIIPETPTPGGDTGTEGGTGETSGGGGPMRYSKKSDQKDKPASLLLDGKYWAVWVQSLPGQKQGG
ncbi:MAG: ORF4 protein [Upsilontorquevirus procy2]|uniref:ORF4 protein n=1 Tax=Anelloviridae sp. TaxID=2055263 RepID=A0A3G2YTE6_9VIRU|nr:MAG: ORF4 protein [Anelloviridae sp.]AYP28953.1 MAG: ORF4 protein [Anelloviridae sp.]